ncbi:MAG TPA: tripartite tricarboxylate transporter substrate binding protein [Xanthobacteraceae bacterium]|jgi:tripartite-type tricarboxylate transporter receptor subunit TctC|nr:tripartite tricarboxylate transporter substrate binding protein [Xanthobacteraceae bacterium]
MRIRVWLLALLVAGFAAMTVRAQEPTSTKTAPIQDYPNHVVKIVLPVLPGSTTDILARLVADQLSQKWGKPVIVENMPGAAMNIGSEYVAQADPDGYTLLICPPSPLSINKLLYHNLRYDPAGFVPIALLAKIPNVLAVQPNLPANTIPELLAYGKANPGKLSYASQGVGSTAHLSGSELEVLTGIKMVHVPYHGAQPALTDLMAGNVDMFFDTLTTSVPLYRGGKLKLLGVANTERSSDIPEVPTIDEAGIPGFRSITWFAMAGPAGTPPALVEKINRDVADILKKPEVVNKLHSLRLEPMGGTTADARRFIAEETTLWGRVINESHITLD